MKKIGFLHKILFGVCLITTPFFKVWAQEIPDPDFRMIGYASVSESGLETTTGGEGGITIVIETLAELINWGAGREDNNTPEIVIIKGKIEAESTVIISIKRGGNISILGDQGSGNGFGELKNVSIIIWKIFLIMDLQ